jgi:hypothetical protein
MKGTATDSGRGLERKSIRNLTENLKGLTVTDEWLTHVLGSREFLGSIFGLKASYHE